jgi:hypothetical protein
LLPAAQSEAAAQLVLHAEPLQTNAPQDIVCREGQLPFPSQLVASCSSVAS